MVFMHCTWVLGALLVTLSFIIAGVALVSGVVWYDACHFIDIITEDFNNYVPSATGAKALNACYNGTSLAVAFNMSQRLDFRNRLTAMSSKLQSFTPGQTHHNLSAPLVDLDNSLMTFDSTSIMLALNEYTNYHGFYPAASCQYSDSYTWVNLDTPWVDNLGKGNTAWSAEPYARSGSESAINYLTRLYQDATCGTAVNTPLLDAWSSASSKVRKFS